VVTRSQPARTIAARDKPSRPSAADRRFEDITVAAARLMTELKVPGAAIAVMHDRKIETAGIGVTNVDDPQPVTDKTQFFIGSATKPFTATVILKMAERGELDLDAPIRKYLPDFQVGDIEASEKSRVIDLFQHRTGWQGDFIDDLGSGEEALEQAVRAMRFLPQRTPYGTVWAYNNSNYIIAGRLIQFVSRAKSYEQRVRDELLVPLGMSRTSFFMAELLGDRFAVGHGAVFDGKSRPKPSFSPLPRSVYPAGGLISNATDMMKWVLFQFDGKDKEGRQLLSTNLLKRAQSPLVQGELDQHLGIAWFVESFGDVRTASHAGRIQGFTGKVLFAPERQFAIVVLTNGDRGAEVYDSVIGHALKSYLGVEKNPPTEVVAQRADLKPFVAMWIGDLEDYRIYLEGDRLKTRRLFKPAWAGAPKAFEDPPPISLGSAGKDLVIMTDGPYQGTIGKLLRDESGEPQFLQMQHRIFRRAAEEDP